MTNNGSISIAADTEELAGAVGGSGVLQPLQRQSSVRLERFGRADHQRDRRGRAHAQGGAVLRRHDQRFRDRRHDRRDELCRDGDVVQFRREFGWDRRHAHAAPTRVLTANILMTGDYSNSRFHPRPRQRDRHAGEVRLTRRRKALLRSPASVKYDAGARWPMWLKTLRLPRPAAALAARRATVRSAASARPTCCRPAGEPATGSGFSPPGCCARARGMRRPS